MSLRLRSALHYRSRWLDIVGAGLTAIILTMVLACLVHLTRSGIELEEEEAYESSHRSKPRLLPADPNSRRELEKYINFEIGLTKK
jgi:hypothetical protein